jgi:hypothetical protein
MTSTKKKSQNVRCRFKIKHKDNVKKKKNIEGSSSSPEFFTRVHGCKTSKIEKKRQ